MEHRGRPVRPPRVTVLELRRAAPFLVIPLLLLLVGCGLLPWELPGVEPSPLPGGEARVELERQHGAWRRAAIDDYAIDLRFGCFCPAQDPVRVTVVDGLVTAVTLPTGEPANDWYRGFPLTVEAIYTHAAGVLERGGTADITYGEDGVPERLAFDPIPEAVDDELGIEVLAFTPAG